MDARLKKILRLEGSEGSRTMRLPTQANHMPKKQPTRQIKLQQRAQQNKLLRLTQNKARQALYFIRCSAEAWAKSSSSCEPLYDLSP